MPNYYPIMLKVRDRQTIVLGGERIAAEKASALAACGAQVTVQWSAFCPELLELAEQGKIALLQKVYEPGDLAEAFVIVAAINEPTLVEQIWQETQARGQLLNVVDVPAYCNYIIPSILRRGQLTVAVSTEGASPSLAKRIRQQLETHFPPTYATYMQLATVVRAYMRSSGLSYDTRDDFFGEFFTSDILRLLTEGEETQALALSVELLRRYHVSVSIVTLTADLREAAASYDNHAKI
jgi:precorrin-2 dehydrogenase / sirohydrochlorin ferrochelatase